MEKKEYLNPEDCKDWITETEVKTFRITMRCPECGSDELFEWAGSEKLSNPPWYPHKCLACNYKVNLRKKYPHTIHKYKEVNDDTGR